MMEQNTTMNIALYKALLDAGIKEEHALAAATEAANNGMSVDGSLAKLDSDIKELRFDMEKSMARLTDRLTWRMIGTIIGAIVGTISISMAFTYFMMNQVIRLLGS